MKNKKFDDFYKIYQAAKSEAEEYTLLKTFMMSCTVEELMAWNQYLAEKSSLFWKKNKKTQLSDADNKALADQFEKIDTLTAQITQPFKGSSS